eukprot:gene7277-8457_t
MAKGVKQHLSDTDSPSGGSSNQQIEEEDQSDDDDNDGHVQDSGYVNTNDEDDYDDEDTYQGIILEPIVRDPQEYKEKSLLSSQDEIQDGDELMTKFKKTVGKTNKLLKQAVLDSNKKIENGVKRSNKKLEDAVIGGLGQVAGVGIKAVDAVRDQHNRRVEKHEHHERAIWIKDKQQISKYECLDYVTIYNKAYRQEMYKNFNKLASDNEWQRWLVSLFMGIFIGLIAYVAHQGVSYILYYKFKFATDLLDYENDITFFLSFFAFFLCNTVLATLSSLLAVYYEPTAAGSGIPEVKGYLNGTKIPHTLKFKTLWTKLASMILAVSSSMCVGGEGPMIHMGAIVGNGFSQAQSKEFGFKVPFLRNFRNDKDKRDFVTSGAGAGVAAAFKAPLGGALFSLEEVSSFWSTALTWRSFFACLVATFVNHNLQVLFTPHPTMIFDMSQPNMDTTHYYEYVLFLIVGVLGGLTGALFTLINVRVMKMRRTYINKIKSARILEVFAISAAGTCLQFFLPLLFSCKPLPLILNDEGMPSTAEELGLRQFTCEPGYFNDMASLIFHANEEAITNLLSIFKEGTAENLRPEMHGLIGIGALLLYFVYYFLFAAYSAGSGISSGTFVPMIVIGASYGRAIGIVANIMFPNVDPGVYALMGAAAFMAGVSRLTISLTVILIETTNELPLLIPIMITIMVAKWTADLLIHPMFDLLIDMKYIPYLEPNSSRSMRILMCKHIMAKKPFHFTEKTTLGRILHVLKETSHNGFPVVNNATDRCVKGLILRSQLLMVLETLSDVYISNKEVAYSHQDYTTKLAWKLPALSDFRFDPEDYSIQVDLTNIMNLTCLTVNEEFAVSEAFHLFRTMGLRHMPVVNENNKIKGIITKKDLLEKTCEQRYRELSHMKLGVDQLERLDDE